jgi:uncharacterized OsmC-like protein
MSIRDAVAAAGAYLTDHPEDARYRDGLATARLERGLRAVVTDTEGRQIATDMTTGIGGENTAPSPGWLLRAAAASCVTTLVAIRAAVLGLELERVVVEVDSESDDRGILGLEESVPAGPLSVRARVDIAARGASRDDLEAIVSWAVDHCPVTDAIRRAVPIEVELA